MFNVEITDATAGNFKDHFVTLGKLPGADKNQILVAVGDSLTEGEGSIKIKLDNDQKLFLAIVDGNHYLPGILVQVAKTAFKLGQKNPGEKLQI